MASPAADFGARDLLGWPVLGRLLRWRHARATLQTAMLCLAGVVVVHGLLGPPLAPTNLATVLTWVHYRGLLVVALVMAGNLSCTACPMILVRDLGRRVRKPSRRWPARLRGKWIALALLAGVFFLYEWLDLWSSPRGTAWLLVGYFVAALAVDLTFSGATFCKHLCPIGQFNFVASTLSPLEMRVKDRAGCVDCRTHDCIRGVRTGAGSRDVVQRGCELGLFLPGKVGNLDCTLCLDCVQACPRENVALSLRVPGVELYDGARQSGIGRLARRPDMAALALVFTFSALVNAFGMTAPAYALQERLADLTGVRHEAALLAVVFGMGLVAVPVVLAGAAAAGTRRLAGSATPVHRIAIAYAYALVPLGFAVWLAHYGFHLLTGLLTPVPVLQGLAASVFQRPILGEPLWGWVGMRPGSVYPIEIGLVLLGAIGSWAVAHGISQRDFPGRPGSAGAPWTVLVALLAAAGVWVLSQPMEMRGTFL